MKKLLAIILTAVLVCSFAGCCFTTHVEAEKDRVSAGEDQFVQQPTLPVDSDIIDGIFEGVHDAINSKLTRGSVSGNVYTSEYNGLTFAPPSDWVFSSDEEIAEAMGVGLDVIGDDVAFNEALTNLASVYDAMAQGVDGSNINISYENLTVTGGTGYDEEGYLDVVKNQLSLISSITYTFAEGYDTVSLSGETFTRMSAELSGNGVTIAQNYYVRRIDNYMCIVVITGMATEPAVIEAYFN